MRPIKVILFLLLLEVIWGCGMNRVERWPYRGSLIEVINDTNEPLSVVAHSDQYGGHLITHRLWPQSHVTFRWPWISTNGMLLATPHNTFVFQPWDESRWCWVVSEPTIRRGKCP